MSKEGCRKRLLLRYYQCDVRVFYSKILTFVKALSIQPTFLELHHFITVVMIVKVGITPRSWFVGVAGMISLKFTPVVIQTWTFETVRREMTCISLRPYLFSLFITGLVKYYVYIRTPYNSCVTIPWSNASCVSGSSNPPTLPDHGTPRQIFASGASTAFIPHGVCCSLGVGVYDIPSSSKLVITIKTVSELRKLLRFHESLAWLYRGIYCFSLRYFTEYLNSRQSSMVLSTSRVPYNIQSVEEIRKGRGH
jgi:hypothetical protein